ncbi:type II secretion system GspH family protein [Fictibacillus sp. WQ 8-8]|uniref:type II secretion system protein n=1 Tax=Fictibacillus sp. WQ 8-8 TaxID=2938788 RepID=UPI00210BDC81|nr:type II secretion system protein [Fictibacillus sp. WQ 8-8]MCQ6266443.1 type II secretion system GspH family protein [Fictibacillus sp. WQ 8-8]
MRKLMQKYLKNEKGLTLIELLVVVVILGIIAAIAVLSIGGILDNSKKDAHVGNAKQMINAAKMAVTADPDTYTGTKYLSLNFLQKQGYLDDVADPDKTSGGYTTSADTAPTAEAPTGSYVVVTKTTTNNYTYSVKLINGTRGVKNTDGSPVEENIVKRDKVN